MHDHTTGTFNLQLQWLALAPPLQSQFRSFVVEYRQEQPDGSYGVWQLADTSGLSASSTGYSLSVSQDGNYQVRATAVLSTGQRVTLIRAPLFDRMQDRLRSLEGMVVHAYPRENVFVDEHG